MILYTPIVRTTALRPVNVKKVHMFWEPLRGFFSAVQSAALNHSYLLNGGAVSSGHVPHVSQLYSHCQEIQVNDSL